MKEIICQLVREFPRSRYYDGQNVTITLEVSKMASAADIQIRASYWACGDNKDYGTGGCLLPNNPILVELWPEAEIVSRLNLSNENGVPCRCMSLALGLYEQKNYKRLASHLRVTEAEIQSQRANLDRQTNSDDRELEMGSFCNTLRQWWATEARMAKTFIQSGGRNYVTISEQETYKRLVNNEE